MFAGMKLQGVVTARGRQKVGPLEDLGEVELVEGVDDGGDGGFGADDQNFDGLSVGFGVAVEFEGEFEAEGVGGLGGVGEKLEGLHDDHSHCHLI